MTLGRDGLFAAKLGNQVIRAKTVLMATGVVDTHPDMPGLPDAIHRGLIRYCAICDGFDVTGRRVGVIGRGTSGLYHALFLRTYTDDITHMSLGEPLNLSPEELASAKAAGISKVPEPVTSLAINQDQIACRSLQGNACTPFDNLHVALGNKACSYLARGMGAHLDDKGYLVTNEHQQSSISSLYAAGEFVSRLDQIRVAMGEAATAATAIHNVLRKTDVV